YFIFFFPGVLALIFAGADYASESWFYKEVSVMSPANVPIFQFKTVIPIAGALLFLQGIAQVFRCIICIRTGKWPPHLEDVEEMETMLLHQHEDQKQIEKEMGLDTGSRK
ncbi:MAG: TRAP transporter small permease subunit, partial [Hyphomicrobiales bacterium]